MRIAGRTAAAASRSWSRSGGGCSGAAIAAAGCAARSPALTRGPHRRGAAALAERANLLGQLLDLGGQRAHLRLQSVDAHVVGAEREAAAGACAAGGAAPPRASDSSVPTTTCMSTSCSSSCSTRCFSAGSPPAGAAVRRVRAALRLSLLPARAARRVQRRRRARRARQPRGTSDGEQRVRQSEEAMRAESAR